MAEGQRKVAQAKSEIVAELPTVCGDERMAVEFMEQKRWGDTPACPRCGDTDVYQMRDAETGERNRRWLWRCRGCKQQFTVRVGTIMEDSPIPLRHWCYAFWAACASKKGVSAKQIQRMTGVTYKSALFMMHRIRWAMAPANEAGGMLSGDVEVDETYIGGKPRRLPFGSEPRRNARGKRLIGRGTDKQPVAGLLQRGGRVKTFAIPTVTAKNLKRVIRESVDPSSRILTDEFLAYRGIGAEFAGGHETVRHSIREYVRGDVHTNTIECYWALLKRGLTGTFHSVSRTHLHRYLAEFDFRFNNRKIEDGERVKRAIQAADGRRLTYKQQTGHE